MSSSRNYVNALFFSCVLFTVSAGAQAQSLNETVNQAPVANPATVVVNKTRGQALSRGTSLSDSAVFFVEDQKIDVV